MPRTLPSGGEPEPEGRWSRLGQTLVHDGWLKVRRDRYRMPDGREADWEILREPDSVLVLAFSRGAVGVLTFAQYRPGPRLTLRELVGGGIEPGEDPIDAARRELLEETGWRAGAVFHAGAEWASASSTRRRHAVVASDCEPDGPPQWDAFETGQVAELPIDDLLPHLLGGALTDAGPALRALHTFARLPAPPDGMGELYDAVRRLLAP